MTGSMGAVTTTSEDGASEEAVIPEAAWLEAAPQHNMERTARAVRNMLHPLVIVHCEKPSSFTVGLCVQLI